MIQRRFGEKYITKAEDTISFKDDNFPNMPLYQESDIKAAFNAGREFIEYTKLKWERVYKLDHTLP